MRYRHGNRASRYGNSATPFPILGIGATMTTYMALRRIARYRRRNIRKGRCGVMISLQNGAPCRHWCTREKGHNGPHGLSSDHVLFVEPPLGFMQPEMPCGCFLSMTPCSFEHAVRVMSPIVDVELSL